MLATNVNLGERIVNGSCTLYRNMKLKDNIQDCAVIRLPLLAHRNNLYVYSTVIKFKMTALCMVISADGTVLFRPISKELPMTSLVVHV